MKEGALTQAAVKNGVCLLPPLLPSHPSTSQPEACWGAGLTSRQTKARPRQGSALRQTPASVTSGTKGSRPAGGCLGREHKIPRLAPTPRGPAQASGSPGQWGCLAEAMGWPQTRQPCYSKAKILSFTTYSVGSLRVLLLRIF